METKFNQFKAEILKRAKAGNACAPEYGRAYKSESFEELITVIKDNFNFAVTRNVIDPTIIEEYKEEFNVNNVWCNVDCSSGYLLAWGNATVEAWGNATVEAWDNATVEAWGNATVEASDNATVKASDNATVKAWGNATVKASDNAYISSFFVIECKLSDNAIYRIRQQNVIRYASRELKFEKVNN